MSWLRWLYLGVAVAVGGCAERPPLPTAPPPRPTVGDTVYVPVLPEWTGFRRPSAVLVGREPFIYVADTENDRIVMLDLAGRVVGTSPPLLRPVAIAQDGHFDLLVCGELDTLLSGRRTRIGAVFRIRLRESAHDIARAPIRLAYAEPERPQRRFTGVAVLPDNSYLLARTGPQNTSPIDPDDAVLHIGADDRLRSPIPTLRPGGIALNAIEQLSGIAVSANGVEMVMLQRGPSMQYRVQWLRYVTARERDGRRSSTQRPHRTPCWSRGGLPHRRMPPSMLRATCTLWMPNGIPSLYSRPEDGWCAGTVGRAPTDCVHPPGYRCTAARSTLPIGTTTGFCGCACQRICEACAMGCRCCSGFSSVRC
jgi:hypothetical protein